MKPSLFRPRQLEVPPALVLIPYFSKATLFDSLQRNALRRQDILNSTVLWFENMAIISGFIGYPHLLTLLQLVSGLAGKDIYFLGSAGALQPRFHEPAALQVGSIRPSSVLRRFSRCGALELERFADDSFPVVSGVSVDIIQRETPAWLAEQRALGTGIVEMELFALRWFLARPFHALVVLSDRVQATGIRPFAEKKKFNSEFHRAFQAIARTIDHEKSNPDPPLSRRGR